MFLLSTQQVPGQSTPGHHSPPLTPAADLHPGQKKQVQRGQHGAKSAV